MTIIDDLKNYITDEGTYSKFVGHKCVHIAAGAFGAVCAIALHVPHSVIVGIGVAFVFGVLKEIVDQVTTTGPYHESYISSVLDIIVTTLGGVAGISVMTVVSTPVAIIGTVVVGIIGLIVATS